MLAGKRLLKQALVLTVSQVKGLHAALRNVELHIMDRAVVSYLLMALYGRCRNSDLLMIHSIETDFNESGGFLVLQTCNHKTGRLAALKTKLMPIIIPARGIDGSIWAGLALEILASAGMIYEAPIGGPLLNAPAGEAGTFMKRGLRASEVSAMLRRFVGLSDPLPGCRDEIVSSHSLKATTLAWCARYGISPSSRSLLGRHASSLNETFAIYSRDLVCAPVVELQRVIDSIAEGKFSPDSQRSEFFNMSVVSKDLPEADDSRSIHSRADASAMSELYVDESCPAPDAVNAGLDADVLSAGPDEPAVDDSDSSSDSDGSLVSVESFSQEPVARVKRFRARIPAEESWFVHARSHLVHRYNGNEHFGQKFLVCGKLLTDAYGPCTESSAWNVLRKSCNRR